MFVSLGCICYTGFGSLLGSTSVPRACKRTPPRLQRFLRRETYKKTGGGGDRARALIRPFFSGLTDSGVERKHHGKVALLGDPLFQISGHIAKFAD